MALESLPKIAPALFSPEQDLIEVYNKKTGTVGVINPSYIKSSPSGSAGAIQFSDGSAFSSDSSNLFWDNTNKRLGVGTNAPSTRFHVVGETTFSDNALFSTDFKSIGRDLNNSSISFASINSQIRAKISTGGKFEVYNAGIGQLRFEVSAGGQTTILGGGSTSATTSLLVQNSAGTTAFQIKDDMQVSLPSTASNNTLAIGGQVGTQKNGVGVGYSSGSSVVVRGGLFVNPNTDTVELYGGSNSIMSWVDGEVLFKNANNGAIISNPSAIVTIDSTTQGFLPPRMTTTQINAIASPAEGLVAYNTTISHLCCYKAGAWVKFNHSPM